MAFSTKLNLDNSKFEQTTGSTLNLAGDTIISNDGNLNYESNPDFTTDTQIVTKKYVDDNIVSGTTSGTTYNGASPAAVTVGGITAGTELTGKTSNELLEELLVPTLFPTLTAPSNGFSDNAGATQEVGDTIGTINFTATFDRGSITPAYGTSGFRSGLPNEYNYTDNGNVDQSLPATQASTSLTDNQSLTSVVVQAGVNQWSSSVDYDAGEQPLDSVGGNFDSPLPAGTTGLQNVSFTGIYPYFYGTSVSAPVVGDALIASGTKQVLNAGDPLTINFGGAITGEYVWFAVPTSSKYLTWIEPSNVSNNGSISDTNPADLFDYDDNTSLNSPDTFWSSIGYDVYYTRLATTVTSGTLRFDK